MVDMIGAHHEPRRVRIAVYLPDDSALLSRDVWVIDADDDQVGSISINPWTGLPETRRINAWELASENPDDEAEEDDDMIDEAPTERGRGKPIDRNDE